MGDYRDDDFREKPSWRDRDRRKDRSRHVGQGDFPTGQSSQWVRKQILREADKLFQGKRSKKVDPEQETARNEIHLSCGTKKFDPAARKYLKEYGLPKDPKYPATSNLWQKVLQPVGGIALGAANLGAFVFQAEVEVPGCGPRQVRDLALDPQPAQAALQQGPGPAIQLADADRALLVTRKEVVGHGDRV